MRLLAELWRRDRVLTSAGGVFAVLAAMFVVAAAIDGRTVLGINVWIKPLKFAVSIAIYLVTLAWLLGELPATVKGQGLVRWGAVVAMVVEIACIAGQSARGWDAV